MSTTNTECRLQVCRSAEMTTAILHGAGKTEEVFIAYRQRLFDRPERSLWHLEHCGDGGDFSSLGVWQGGPVGEYPDRERAEAAMWSNLAGDVGVLTGFTGDGGG